MDNLTKIEKQLLKEQQKNFKKKFNAVRSKVRRIKSLSKEDKKVLLDDLANVNGDLMDVLFYDKDPWSKVDDYLNDINAYLKSEMHSYDYGKTILAYMPTKMALVMEVIREHHKNLDRYNELKGQIMGTDAK